MQSVMTMPIGQNLLFSAYAVPGMNRELIGNTKAMYILEMVSKSLNISISDIIGYSREREKVIARHIAMYLIYNRTTLGYKPVGNIFWRDHTTVIHACTNVRNDLTLKYETDIVTKLRNIENQLKW